MLDTPIRDVNITRVFDRSDDLLPVVDTSACMQDGFERFMKERVFPRMKPGMKIFVEVVVLYELRKHATGPDPEKALAARRALVFLNTHSDRFSVVGRASDKGLADAFFLGLVSKKINKYHIVLITEDKALTRSVQNLYRNMSCIKGKRSLTIMWFSSDRMKTWYDSASEHDSNRPRRYSRPFKQNAEFRLKFPNALVFAESKAITLGGSVGSGAKSRVFDADPDRVAKILHPSVFANDTAYESFFARITKLMDLQISHENIVTPDELIFDSEGDDKSPVGFLMRKVRGSTMHALLNKGQLSFAERVDTVAQLASALDHLHENGVSVPDLRLDNIMLDGEMSLSLIDCDGFSVPGVPKEASCNYLYDPPRASTGDPMSFRFGVISFQILTGKHPYLQSSVSIRDAIEALDFQITLERAEVLDCLSQELRFAYMNTLKYGRAPSLKTWREFWEAYRKEIEEYSATDYAV